MKNLWITASILLSVLVFFSCEKETMVEPTNTASNAAETVDISSTPFKVYEAEPIQGMLDENDAQNKQVNIALFHFANAIKNLIQDDDIHQFILDEIEKTPFNDANIITLAEKNQTLKTLLNKELRKSLEEYVEHDLGITSHNDYYNDNFNIIGNLTQFIIYNDISYYPSVYTLHDVKKDIVEKSAIAIGEQVDADDNIQGWIGNQLILLNEKSISRYKGNVILIGNGDYNLLKIDSKTNFKTSQKPLQNTAIDKALGDDIYVTSFKIKGCQFRYERFGASEIRGFYRTHVLGSGNFWAPATNIGIINWNRSENEICNQTPNTGNKYFSGIHFNDAPGFPGSGNLYNNLSIIGFYERDGYSSPKVVVGSSSTGQVAQIEVRMKYSHEWYVKDIVDSLVPYYINGTGDIHHYDTKKALFETQILQ